MPLSLAWVASSIVSGQLVSRTGRYRAYPIIGSLLVLLGFIGLALVGADSSRVTVVLPLIVIGAGMGLMVQVYILAAQNAVNPAQIGVTTSTLQFFRSMGGTLTVAAMGALLTNRLTSELGDRLGSRAGRVDPDRLLQGGARIPRDLLDQTREALAAAIHSVFVVGIPVALAGVVIALALRERPLRRTHEVTTVPAPEG
jgi:MFS family permease